MIRLLACTFILALSFGCTKKSGDNTTPNQSSGNKIRVALILDKGGKDDKSFNTAAWEGALKAKKEFDIELKDIESPDDSAYEPAMRTFGERGFDLIVAIGFAQKDAVAKVAPQFPKTQFALVDAVVDAPNVLSMMFKEHEGSFLVGYLAGLTSKTGTIGFVGGMDIAMIRRFLLGYESGAKLANPKIKVVSNFVGVTSDAWANPTRGKELAIGQFGRKADVIYAGAGASNLGVFDAAEEKKFFAIGCDSNQNGIKPGRILTSMLKRVDVAVYEAIAAKVKNTFQVGTRHFGLADQGIDYAVDSNNEKLVAPHKAAVDKVKADIIAGKIIVPDHYITSRTK
ncbi:MAG: BMP family protein [Bdellovibrionales bacterium]